MKNSVNELRNFLWFLYTLIDFILFDINVKSLYNSSLSIYKKSFVDWRRIDIKSMSISFRHRLTNHLSLSKLLYYITLFLNTIKKNFGALLKTFQKLIKFSKIILVTYELHISQFQTLSSAHSNMDPFFPWYFLLFLFSRLSLFCSHSFLASDSS